MRTVYMDHAAATPLAPDVVSAMTPYFADHFGNPQSVHEIGNRSARAVEAAREKTAALLHAPPEGVLFTASGSEANNLAIKGIALAQRKRGDHLVVSAIEHASILHATRSLRKIGFTVTEVPVDGRGFVDPDAVRAALTPRTLLVSVMHANTEIGTIQPVADIAACAKEAGVPFHTDAWASTGNVPVDVEAIGADAVSIGGQGFGGPQGTGALWMRKGLRLQPLIDGGIQESGRRAGTENVAALAGLGKAAETAARTLDARARSVTAIRDHLIRRLTTEIDGVVLTGCPPEVPGGRLPGHVSVCVEGVEGEALLLLLAQEGIYASSGSACTSRALKASHVLLAIGLDDALAQGSLVFTMNETTTREDADAVVDALTRVAERLRAMSPVYRKPSDDASGAT